MTAFFFVLNVVLLFRFLVFFHDDRLSGRESIIIGALLSAIFLLFFTPNGPMLCLLAIMLMAVGASWWADRGGGQPRARLCMLVVQVVAIGIVTSSALGLSFRREVPFVLHELRNHFLPFEFLAACARPHAQIYIAGALLCMLEANLLVRWLIELLKLKPKKKAPETGSHSAECVDPAAEYNRGRVIGCLERIAVYFLVLQRQYEALGLVLAAKGLARFNNLDNKDFAEYFLIGTFLSVILSGLIALGVQAVL